MWTRFCIGTLGLLLLMGAVVRADDPQAGPALPSQSAAASEPAAPEEVVPRYWIGVACRPVGADLRAQLNVPEGEGLVVTETVPDSPAAHAKLQRFDILLKADGKSLTKVRQLAEIVGATGKKALKLDVLRGGKPTEITITPEKRPVEIRPNEGGPNAGTMDWSDLEKWFDQMQSGRGGGRPMRFRFLQPGMILPGDVPLRAPLPEDVMVTITKEGKQPAKIVVKRGDKTYEATEETVDKLPEDVRPYVNRMLQAASQPMGKGGSVLNFVPDWNTPGWISPAPDEDLSPGVVEKRLEEMNRHLDQLRKRIDDLRNWRQERPDLNAPAPEKGPDKT